MCLWLCNAGEAKPTRDVSETKLQIDGAPAGHERVTPRKVRKIQPFRDKDGRERAEHTKALGQVWLRRGQ